MTKWAYYNEHDPFAAAWIRELIKDGLVADGEVDERSIEDVSPTDVRSFRQCHWFAGIAVWSLAARRAGIPDDAPLWSGSAPCQPFSAAGKGAGFADERHVWPSFHYLIEQCGPPVCVGEQVTGADGDAWFDLVSADLDATAYAFGVAETVACGFGAPHKRSRNYWVAHRLGARLEGHARHVGGGHEPRWLGTEPPRSVTARGVSDQLADGAGEGRSTLARRHGGADWWPEAQSGRLRDAVDHTRPGPTNGLWADPDWLLCRDERWRAVEPGTFPLVDAGAFRNRVGLLRGAGNAVTLGQAEGFLRAFIAAVGPWW